jgi:hypothetical protein
MATTLVYDVWLAREIAKGVKLPTNTLVRELSFDKTRVVDRVLVDGKERYVTAVDRRTGKRIVIDNAARQYSKRAAREHGDRPRVRPPSPEIRITTDGSKISVPRDVLELLVPGASQLPVRGIPILIETKSAGVVCARLVHKSTTRTSKLQFPKRSKEFTRARAPAIPLDQRPPSAPISEPRPPTGSTSTPRQSTSTADVTFYLKRPTTERIRAVLNTISRCCSRVSGRTEGEQRPFIEFPLWSTVARCMDFGQEINFEGYVLRGLLAGNSSLPRGLIKFTFPGVSGPVEIEAPSFGLNRQEFDDLARLDEALARWVRDGGSPNDVRVASAISDAISFADGLNSLSLVNTFTTISTDLANRSVRAWVARLCRVRVFAGYGFVGSESADEHVALDAVPFSGSTAPIVRSGERRNQLEQIESDRLTKLRFEIRAEGFSYPEGTVGPIEYRFFDWSNSLSILNTKVIKSIEHVGAALRVTAEIPAGRVSFGVETWLASNAAGIALGLSGLGGFATGLGFVKASASALRLVFDLSVLDQVGAGQLRARFVPEASSASFSSSLLWVDADYVSIVGELVAQVVHVALSQVSEGLFRSVARQIETALGLVSLDMYKALGAGKVRYSYAELGPSYVEAVLEHPVADDIPSPPAAAVERLLPEMGFAFSRRYLTDWVRRQTFDAVRTDDVTPQIDKFVSRLPSIAELDVLFPPQDSSLVPDPGEIGELAPALCGPRPEDDAPHVRYRASLVIHPCEVELLEDESASDACGTARFKAELIIEAIRIQNRYFAHIEEGRCYPLSGPLPTPPGPPALGVAAWPPSPVGPGVPGMAGFDIGPPAGRDEAVVCTPPSCVWRKHRIVRTLGRVLHVKATAAFDIFTTFFNPVIAVPLPDIVLRKEGPTRVDVVSPDLSMAGVVLDSSMANAVASRLVATIDVASRALRPRALDSFQIGDEAPNPSLRNSIARILNEDVGISTPDLEKLLRTVVFTGPRRYVHFRERIYWPLTVTFDLGYVDPPGDGA